MANNEPRKVDEYLIGIDMGTTSVKVTALCVDSCRIVEEHFDSTDTYFVNNDKQSEQDVSKIVRSLNLCMSSFSEKILERVVGIGVCGQMHGLVCWSSKDRPWKQKGESEKSTFFEINSTKISHHYTWQDNRCDPQFLSSLPKPKSHLTVHTGYGCCTLFWLMRNSPETTRNFNRAGTIADLVVTMLCDLDVPKMSDQNAASWGYYDCERKEWNKEILGAAGFPVDLLPDVSPPGFAGELKYSWHRIPKGTPVGVALGDLQSYVLAAMETDDQAIINVSTSAQLVYVAKNFVPSKAVSSVAKTVPFFDEKYLHEAAALNGGNAIATFVSFIQETLRAFGNTNTEKVKIWEHLTQIGATRPNETDLHFDPTFLGERHDPQKKACISNLTSDNFQIHELFRALCRGIINNICSMVSPEKLKEEGIVKIIATGSALLRNEILQSELKSRYKLPVEYKQATDSPFGAALFVSKMFNSKVQKS